MAYATTFCAVRRARLGAAARVYKKVDSQLRGNPAVELAGALDAWPEAMAIATPALPVLGRFVRDGRLVGSGDSLPPRSAVQALVSPGRVAERLARVELGRKGARDKLASLPAGAVVVADSEDESDLAALVALGEDLGRPVIWAGSAGLARHLAALGRGSSAGERTGPVPKIPAENWAAQPSRYGIIVVVGTRNPAARVQVDELVASLDVARCKVPTDQSGLFTWLAGGPPEVVGRLATGGVVVLQAEGDASAEEHAQYAHLLGLVAEELRTAAQLASGRRVDLVATGGETARAVLDAMGETSCHVVDEVEPNIPLLATEREDVGLVTKAGSFGSRGCLVNLVTSLWRWRSAMDGPISAERPQARSGKVWRYADGTSPVPSVEKG